MLPSGRARCRQPQVEPAVTFGRFLKYETPVPDADVEAAYRSSARAVSSVSLKRGTLTQASSS